MKTPGLGRSPERRSSRNTTGPGEEVTNVTVVFPPRTPRAEKSTEKANAHPPTAKPTSEPRYEHLASDDLRKKYLAAPPRSSQATNRGAVRADSLRNQTRDPCRATDCRCRAEQISPKTKSYQIIRLDNFSSKEIRSPHNQSLVPDLQGTRWLGTG